MSEDEKKTVLVTGASSGIGAAAVEALAAEGWRVFAGMHDPADAAGGSRSEVTELPLDITSPDSIAAAVELVEREAGGLDALVNNAGIPGAGPVETVPVETFRAVIETNLIGQFAVTQAFLPQLRAARGRVVFVSSLGGRVAFPYASPYHASKWGLEGLAESLRAEMSGLGVDVVLIEPASMATEIWSKGRASLSEARERLSAEQREVYGEALAGFDEQLAGQEDSEDPETVAEKVVEALTTRSPAERYPVGRGARALTLLEPFVPDAVFDRIKERVASGGA
jgi:NAD(P)-dependent dehydrogenase (short-subunit alcohol dehydrogenase family)